MIPEETMKKMILVFAFISLATLAFAQNTFYIEGGFIPRSTEVDWEENKLNLDTNVLYITLDTRIFAFDYLLFGGDVTTWMVPHDPLTTTFYPFYMSYVFEAGLKIDNFELGYTHRCSHPLATLGYISDPLYKLDSSSDKIWAKLSFEF